MIIFLCILAVLLLLTVCNGQKEASIPYSVTILGIVILFLADKILQNLQ